MLRFALAPDSPHRPAAYLRAVRSLDVAGETDLAAGIALRPIAGVPVTAHGELRARRRGASTDFVPAAFLSTGFDEARWRAGLLGRGYVQAGYVGGRDGTVFADGAVSAERPVWRQGGGAVAIGAGAWAGAQRGAARLDIGPTVTAKIPLRDTTLRVSADYRLRIAGDAAPQSGPAVTVAAGF